MLCSRSATRRGVKPFETSARMWSWRGGSIARIDSTAVLSAESCPTSSEMPPVFVKCSQSLKPASTSAWREKAQKPISSFQ